MTRDFMVDLETAGTRCGSAILSIGIVAMDIDAKELGNTLYVNIDLESCTDLGLTIDPNTFMWWLGQPDEARKALTTSRVGIHHALRKVSDFINENTHPDAPYPRVWGNGVAMDNVVLTEAYRVAGIDRPWFYKGDMCFRTVYALIGHEIERAVPEISHHALHDAKAQAITLFRCLEALGL